MRCDGGGLDLNLVADGYAEVVERGQHPVERFVLLLREQLDMLDAGELIMQRVGDLHRFEVDREDRLVPLGGDGDLLGDILDLNDDSVAKSTSALALRMASTISFFPPAWRLECCPRPAST
ncbi:MAG: hypothetical protein Ct9H300mP7_7110 [Verrucomicrobiota bacterium]|nr:MAG: hypothetical protein Ct9H300mP7_7110 [Verrucomicrobiota bacterium]